MSWQRAPYGSAASHPNRGGYGPPDPANNHYGYPRLGQHRGAAPPWGPGRGPPSMPPGGPPMDPKLVKKMKAEREQHIQRTPISMDGKKNLETVGNMLGLANAEEPCESPPSQQSSSSRVTVDNSKYLSASETYGSSSNVYPITPESIHRRRRDDLDSQPRTRSRGSLDASAYPSTTGNLDERRRATRRSMDASSHRPAMALEASMTSSHSAPVIPQQYFQPPVTPNSIHRFDPSHPVTEPAVRHLRRTDLEPRPPSSASRSPTRQLYRRATSEQPEMRLSPRSYRTPPQSPPQPESEGSDGEDGSPTDVDSENESPSRRYHRQRFGSQPPHDRSQRHRPVERHRSQPPEDFMLQQHERATPQRRGSHPSEDNIRQRDGATPQRHGSQPPEDFGRRRERATPQRHGSEPPEAFAPRHRERDLQRYGSQPQEERPVHRVLEAVHISDEPEVYHGQLRQGPPRAPSRQLYSKPRATPQPERTQPQRSPNTHHQRSPNTYHDGGFVESAAYRSHSSIPTSHPPSSFNYGHASAPHRSASSQPTSFAHESNLRHEVTGDPDVYSLSSNSSVSRNRLPSSKSSPYGHH